jgi:hypothetical protein
MKKTMILCVSLSAFMFFAGCTTGEIIPDQVRDDGGEALTVTMNIPTPYTVRTYADNNFSMDERDECDVVSVDVLVFGPDDKFLYREQGVGITDATGDGSEVYKKNFSVKIKKTDDPNEVTAFIYANVREVIDAAVDGPSKWITPDATTKAQVISGLVFDLPVNPDEGGKWLVLPNLYTRFPMWGQTGTISLAGSSITVPEVKKTLRFFKKAYPFFPTSVLS